MESTASTRAAKEFLVDCIAKEAQREGVPLSDTERDMLYFSETAWTLPNMSAISEAFDQEYDQGAYETKVAALIRNFKARAAAGESATWETWNDSVTALGSEDHYILVVIGIAEPTRMLKLPIIAVAAGIIAILLVFVILFIARR